MTDIPQWVLIGAGVFFWVQLVLTVCLIVLVFQVMKTLKEVRPKVEELTTKVKEIGDKVEQLTESVKSTADTVGARAKSISGSAESIARAASASFEKVSPYVAGLLGAIRLFRAFQELRAANERRHVAAGSDGSSAPVVAVDKKGGK